MRSLLAATLLLGAQAASAAWPKATRARPDAMRDGSPTEGFPLCRDLKPHARRLRWDFASSQPNQLSCGAGGGEPSNYILPAPADQPYELHVIAIHDGSFPVQTGDPSAPERSVQVVVYKTRKPAVIVLSARDPVLWDVTVTPEARLELVVLQGRGKQILRGVPEDVPVLKRSWQQACAYAHAWEPRRNLAGPDLPLLMTSVRCATGLRESSFQGCTEGALFEVPHYRQEAPKADAAAAAWENPCPLPADPDIPLPRRRQASQAERLPPFEEPQRATAPTAAAVSPRDPIEATESPEPPREPAQPEEWRTTADARLEEGDRGKAAPPPPEPPLSGHKEDLPAPKGAAGREDIPVRALAILLRGNKTLLTHDAVPDLIIALERGDELLRWRAADALGQLGPAAGKALEPLLSATKEKSWRVRSSAALALGNIGADPKRCAKRLRKLLKDKHPDVRLSAKTSLERLSSD